MYLSMSTGFKTALLKIKNFFSGGKKKSANTSYVFYVLLLKKIYVAPHP